MKCIKNGKTIKRVSNEEAFRLVDNEGWQFCSRKDWKTQVRDKKDK